MTTITWLLELFNQRVFKFQKIIETNPNTIESNVTDEMVAELRDKTREGRDSISVMKARKKLAS